jgi:4-diphosphocytidyl-2-C-methyl-D-erythritol kinase
MADTIELIAPAKLTVELRLTGVRDDGYHLIEAEMVSLELHDVLTVGPGDRLTASGPFSAGMPLDDSNLVRKALRLAGRTAAVHVEKLIPHGGGLGGGSADAAAVLRWCGFDDLVAASRLGADIPFCLRGGRARVTGIGEVLEPLPHLERTVTLIIPPFGVSTPAVFRRWDELGGPSGDHRNDLEPAALDVEPRLVTWRDRITSALGVRPVLAGSGATWFVEGDHADAAEALPEATVAVTRTAPAATGR